MSRSIFAAVLLCTLACSAKPDLVKTKTHADGVVELSYPGNWSLEVKEDDISGIKMRTVSIEPTDGVAQVLSFTPAVPLDVDEFALRLLEGMDVELGDYAVGGVELMAKVDGRKKPVKRTISGAERDGLQIGFTMTALNQKVPMTLHLYAVTTERSSAIVFSQSADEDLGRDRPGFDLVFDSLKLK
jgi:hypothetical protein